MSAATLNYADGQPIRIGDAVLDHDFVPKRVGDILYSDDQPAAVRLDSADGRSRLCEGERLGLLVLLGRDGGAFPRAAIDALQQRAEAGSPQALHTLGELHMMGTIVPKNAMTAFRMWARAAEKDYAPSLHRLGEVYAEGNQMVAADLERAFSLHLTLNAGCGMSRRSKKLPGRVRSGDHSLR